MIVGIVIGLAAGAALGWTLRAAKQSATTRLIDELYGRKLKLAESDREAAVRALNDNRREMGAYEERFAALDGETERLLHELENTIAARLALESELARKEAELAALRDETARAVAFADEALRESAESARERERAVSAAEAERSTLVGLRAECERLQAIEAALVHAHAELIEREARLSEADETHATLRIRIGALTAAAERLPLVEAELARARAEHERRERELERAWTERHEGELGAAHGEREMLAARIAALDGAQQRTLEVAARAAELESRVAELSRELGAAREQIAHLDAELARSAETKRELSEREGALQRELADARRNEQEMRAQLAALGASHRSKQLALDRHAARVVDLEQALPAHARSERAASAPRRNGKDHDDLKRIAGIGPVLEKKLHRIGLRSFAQLAALSRTELDSVAAKLGLSHERIRRERWIASARELSAKRA